MVNGIRANDFQYSRDEKEYVGKQIAVHNLDETAHPHLLGAVDELRQGVEDSVKKESGKGLSTNDFTNKDKENILTAISYSSTAVGIASAVENELPNYVLKKAGKGLSSNDYTDADKENLTEAVGKVEIFSADMKVYARQEQERVSAEKVRQGNESKRQTEENIRIQAEGSRELKEDERVSNEKARNAAELSRANAEAERIRMERIRVDAEEARRNAEADRELLYPRMVEATERAEAVADGVDEMLAVKVDKVDGMGLSTNDYSDEEKSKVIRAYETAQENKNTLQDAYNEINGLWLNKVDKEDGKGLSTNDYNDTEKLKVGEAHEQINRLWVSLDETQQTVNGLSSSAIIIGKSKKSPITDCADGPVTSLNLYGYSTQNGTPSLSSPAQIYPVEAPYFRGCGADISINNPDTLFGIPVESGGNYTDAGGQSWICDEIDFVNRKYIKRCEIYTFTGAEKFSICGDGWHVDGLATAFWTIILSGDKTCANTNSFCYHILSPNFKAGKWNFSDKSVNDVCCLNATNGYLRFSNAVTDVKSTDTTEEKVAKVKAFVEGMYLQGKALSILYPLATPVETAFEDAVALAEYAKMQTTYPSVNVSSNANFLIGYKADTQHYIDNKFEALTNAIISLGGNV